jgi:hypothetical protein
VYATGESELEDNIAFLTINNLPNGSYRFVASVLAAYVLFPLTMWLLMKEFEWFIDHRHKFLSEFNTRNYSVFVQNIPPEYRDDKKLKKFFCRVFGQGSVLEARVDLKVPGLEKKCMERDALHATLEHTIAEKNFLGKESYVYRHNTENKQSNYGVRVEAIDAYTKELDDLNRMVERGVIRLEKRKLYYQKKEAERRQRKKEKNRVKDDDLNGTDTTRRTVSFRFEMDDSNSYAEVNQDGVPKSLASVREDCDFEGLDEEAPLDDEYFDKETKPNEAHMEKEVDRILDEMVRPQHHESLSNESNQSGEADKKHNKKLPPEEHVAVSGRWYGFMSEKSGITNSALDGVVEQRFLHRTARDNEEYFTFRADGIPKNAGFVTFTRLSFCQAARQLLQHHTPHAMDIVEAPEPDEVFWDNVGLLHTEVILGRLGAFCLTLLLLIVWTVPIAAINIVSDIESLDGAIPFLQDWVDNNPQLQHLFAQLAPLFLVGLNIGMLPEIVKIISRKEGHFSEPSLESAAFLKVSFFTIVQTFFVSTVTGTIAKSMSDIRENPERILRYMAQALPQQSTYFLQVILVSVFLGVPFELFRCAPLAQAMGAAMTGYHLTWKEKMQSKPPLFSLEDPMRFQYARIFSNDILIFVVIFTYATMAPILSWFVAPGFVLMEAAYRHNYIFNYAKKPDSGGVMWLNFLRILLPCMLVGQTALLAYLVVKEATVAWPFLIPLIIATILWSFYVGQKHFWVAAYLPADRSLVVDSEQTKDFSEFRGNYVRPILVAERKEVDWDHGKSDLEAKVARQGKGFFDRFVKPLVEFEVNYQKPKFKPKPKKHGESTEEADEQVIAVGSENDVVCKS